MTFILKSAPTYPKSEKAFLKKHPDLLTRYQRTLEMLGENPFYPSLRLHALRGHLCDVYSVSITSQYRITLEFMLTEKEIILINVGDHDKVYR